MSMTHRFLFILFVPFFCCIAGVKSTCASLDSLVGIAEVQRAGTQMWQKIGIGEKLYNNDILRVQAHSFAKLGWPDESASFLHENSQIMLTFYESSSTPVISRHITVFYGAVFFIIKEVFPKTFIKQYDTKVFTPTSVVSLRGTSFSVTVDKDTKNSTIRVVNGTIQLKNILKNSALFVSAGFKSTVESGQDPTRPQTIFDRELDSLREWVPVPVIEMEMATQLAKASRDHDVIAGNLKDKLLIIPFVNSSKYTGKWHIQSGLAQMLASQLQVGNLAVEIDDSAYIDPVKRGEKQSARFVVSGEITDFDITQHAVISAAADEYSEYYVATVKIHLMLVAISDKRIVMDETFSAETKGNNSRDNSWQRISRMSFSLTDKQFSKTLLGTATAQVIDQAIDKLMVFIRLE